MPLSGSENRPGLTPSTQGLSPAPSQRHLNNLRHNNDYSSRPRSIQRSVEEISSLAPSYNAGNTRADQSALDHIRRIRRNMPSQQQSRMSRDLSRDYLSAIPVNAGNSGSNSSKIENYKRIKQEEAAARAQLMAPRLDIAGPQSQQRHGDLK